MKRVNVTANSPVHGVYITPIIGKLFNKEMSEDQIYRCLVGGAKVEEILLNNETVQLTFKNYNKNNNKELKFDQLVFNTQTKPNMESVNEDNQEDNTINVDEEVENLVKDDQEDNTINVDEEVENLIEDDQEDNTINVNKELVEEVKKEVAKPQININGRRHHKK